MILYHIVIIGGVFCAFVTATILFFGADNNQFANRFLGMVIFSWAWYALSFVLQVTGALVEVPFIWRIPSPLYYLTPACSYLYVRDTLNRESGLRKYDWLHFMPAILHFIELIPFFLQPLSVKREICYRVVNNVNLAVQLGSGLIPYMWHYRIRPFLGLIYMISIWTFLIPKLRNRNWLKAPGRQIHIWLIVFSICVTAIYMGLMIHTITTLKNIDTPSTIPKNAKVAQYLMVAAFFALSIYLFFKPEILYGLPLKSMTSNPSGSEASEFATIEKTEKVIKSANINEQLLNEYDIRLKRYMESEQVFRQQGITINQVAWHLGIPVYHFSYLINQHYKLRFTDFINTYRINYIKDRMQKGALKDLTLEGLAMEAGFSSRSAFFTAFKKHTGLTPTDYQRQLASK